MRSAVGLEPSGSSIGSSTIKEHTGKANFDAITAMIALRKDRGGKSSIVRTNHLPSEFGEKFFGSENMNATPWAEHANCIKGMKERAPSLPDTEGDMHDGRGRTFPTHHERSMLSEYSSVVTQ